MNHLNAWHCYSPNNAVTSVFNANKCGCSFRGVTMLDALSLPGGSTICDATGLLLKQGVAAVLNACNTSGVAYPLTTAQVVSEVNAAIASCDKDTILNEVTRLNNFNNGVGGCPLN